MEYRRGRYSWLLRPFLIVFDLLVINIFALYSLNFNEEDIYFFSNDFFNDKHTLYIIYSATVWFFSSFLLKFYKVYRYTSLFKIASLLFKQFFVYGMAVYAFIGFFRSVNLGAFDVLKYLLFVFAAIGAVKILSYLILKTIRAYLKGNLRNVVIIGSGSGIAELKNIFNRQRELGYNIKASFSDSYDNDTTGNINDSFNFLKNDNSIDELYCAIDELSEKQINEYVKYANLNHCNIKFVPNTSKLFTKRLHTDYYNYLPVLSIKEGSLSNDINKFLKRTFDILFSLFVIIFVLSWFSIILFILLKMESKGPLFYRHKRNGINYKEFYCYKYRSLTVTKETKGTYVKQDDHRVTKIGRFLRRTSIDELPQFINVLKGEMSVVGPRPHMLSYTDDYSKKIDKYSFIFRHHVKPGITGLAQIKGYRGEVESDKDIINRIKYDNFYIENWSLLLDINIIIQTILNVVKGDEKAY
ncbi:exopolysaccharide biosynthesis polyprenyl glycosylphosphotransferase [Tamlana sp. 2201CG12-4]|uniref:exopolysaccharide biosynthesis polyprenyl glycosylphosphotransferase n=1 Tax=Tamlana sp. 2201CG12-4 TaxID=3112582 RepID=UPI002DB8AC3C|nr:exopolysaccharide biosynthesis polyprenyl glycosylphosphotransferase [Tamlana sp. 2201CG12-4]MEC3906315.1 exopolysaccharide biosynthesis polyprenyl glycosylphosphotransferase [Tamlana sp. 2201CG12-4]